jgi:hypothetical protein
MGMLRRLPGAPLLPLLLQLPPPELVRQVALLGSDVLTLLPP